MSIELVKKSNGSMNASNGNKAEDIMCTQPSVKNALASYFAKPIETIQKIPSRPHPKKADLLIKFMDGTTTTIQNKSGGLGGRGYSVDRRDSHLVSPNCEELTTTLKTVCLHQAGVRHEIPKSVSYDVVIRCFLGTEEITKPAWFTHTTMKDGVILSLEIVKADDFINKVCSELYETMNSKHTCIHLSPHIYLQRKGGGKTDKSPDHIQTKFRLTPEIMSIFTSLTL